MANGQKQSGRVWKFAKTLAKATDAFPSQKEADQSGYRPNAALSDRPAGHAGWHELVEQHLERRIRRLCMTLGAIEGSHLLGLPIAPERQQPIE
jgi:uncharacterized protein (DUF2384 family)